MKGSSMSIRVLSLFDGISCGRLALEKAGVEVEEYLSSDIKEAAIKVADYNYPQDTKSRLGDITSIQGKDLGDIDVLIGGSPCQDFSGAHKVREGIEGEKSGLFWEYVRLLKEVKPKYFLLENVRMRKADQDIISEALGCEPIVINSELVAPQLRHRLYWTNIPKDGMPERKYTPLNSILDSGYSDRDKARALLESDSRPLSTPVKMVHRYFNTGFTTLIFKSDYHYEKVKDHFTTYMKGKSAKEIDAMIEDGELDVRIFDGVRYMTKVERERCQTVPEGYTSILTDNEAAGCLGDGWTIDVIAHLLKPLNPLTK